MVATIDAFYGPLGKSFAEKWQAENDQGMVGPNSCFSKTDRRVLWGSYGDFDLDKVHKFYYEDGKYERLGKERSKQDKYGTLTPNTFAVKRA
jgi:hypothetical protein